MGGRVGDEERVRVGDRGREWPRELWPTENSSNLTRFLQLLSELWCPDSGNEGTVTSQYHTLTVEIW